MNGRWIVLALFLSIACGDPLVDGSYRGKPYMRLSGFLRGSVSDAVVRSPHLGILWSSREHWRHVVPALTPILATPLSSSFAFELWDLPPSSVRFPLCGANVAVGYLMVYDDVDGNGRVEVVFDEHEFRILAPDKALGFGVHFLIHTDRAIRNCWPLPDLDAGFHLLLSDECEMVYYDERTVEILLHPPEDRFPLVPASSIDFPECPPI